MYVFYNANFCGEYTGDCVIRSICKAEDMDWHDVYDDLTIQGRMMCAWGDTNKVWESYLEDIGYSSRTIDHPFTRQYTIADFAYDHPRGTYIVCTGTHVVCVQDGIIYDSWDSSNEIPIYYFYRR